LSVINQEKALIYNMAIAQQEAALPGNSMAERVRVMAAHAARFRTAWQRSTTLLPTETRSP
jgi:hypothetical protein